MRAGGCPRRDVALASCYSGMPPKEIMKTYFEKKKKLSRKILESVRDPEKREKIKPYLDLL